MNLSDFAREEIAEHKIVAGISGGKDSAAMSLWLTEQGIEHERVFVDTGWEHPLTYDYIADELPRAIGSITTLQPPRGMADLIEGKSMFPSRIIRYCTSELKVWPLHTWFTSLGVPIVNTIGIRSAESAARSAMLEWDGFVSPKLTYKVWRPLLRWTFQDVIDMHQRHGLAPNPLYLAGASRVGCWPCIHARKADVRLVAQLTPERIDQIRDLEQRLTDRAGKLRTYFQAGPIDEVVDWAKTSHGGRQYDLFDSTDPDAGCVRWGLCGTSEE
jgi:3'-phosphoadenosine 5'-phosphosulfate sulfotransferase (PAPS reductase)/FAD synthetase